MAAKQRGPQQSMKGFRPGKEPAHLKKRRAKAQLGSNASWGQKQAVEAVAGKSPKEVQAMVTRWSTGLFVATGVLSIGGVFLYGWSTPVGVTVHVCAALMAFLGFRLRKSGTGLVEMAGSL